jgi:gamma-glutamyltranspeptidase/glutathione hydrolase
MRAGVAAGHPATCEAGIEILEDHGTAADAAVAACLASCVAETVMTGLLGGGHAIYWDASTRRARNLDCFVAVPSGRGGPMHELQVPFGEELVHYAVGAASCAVPGVPAGLDALWRAHGRLPWARLVEPALRLAAAGVAMPPAHALCLEMLAPVLTLDAGARIYSPGGTLLGAGDLLEQPGLVRALELVRDEGAGSVYRGTIAELLLALSDSRGGALTRADLGLYEARWVEPVAVAFRHTTFLTRDELSGVPASLRRLPPAETDADWVVALVRTIDAPLDMNGDTTNVVTVDADGNACVLTTSLGLGSGDYVPGLDLLLNSMLGERDLVRGDLVPGDRVGSMMAPSIAVDADGPALAIGAAGGTRLRTALVGVTSAILERDEEPQAAVDRPRAHPVAGLVNAEPGVDEDALATLEREGWSLRRWPALHHYFGGVSAIARTGAAADPRRSGAARSLASEEGRPQASRRTRTRGSTG